MRTKELVFGTGGLRGIIGDGADKMNVGTVEKASQGLTNYLNCKKKSADKIAVAYDSRINSELFARSAAGVFAGNGIKTYIFRELMPTPCLSYAVRELNCSAGVVITASHNPSNYNGYKVYGADGCQITLSIAEAIQSEIGRIQSPEAIRRMKLDEGLKTGIIKFIEDSLLEKYLGCVSENVKFEGDRTEKKLSIVYTPLNGSGLKLVTRILLQNGFREVQVVPEQREPDGNFSTCPYPNPEDDQALELGIQLAEKKGADILLATDPDCDRLGVAVPDADGKFVRLTGNELGMLLADYVFRRISESGRMPDTPVFMKTIVTSTLQEQIAEHYGIRTINVLTGFKYIGEQIGLLEKEGKESSFVLGCEESCGYLRGTYVRDKDGVNAALLTCLMEEWYQQSGSSIYRRLMELYQQYGFQKNGLHTYQFRGEAGMDKMRAIMNRIRRDLANRQTRITGSLVEHFDDYENGLYGLPKSNVLRAVLDNGNSFIVRPSGTEPKLKVYTGAAGDSVEQAASEEEVLRKEIEQWIV